MGAPEVTAKRLKKLLKVGVGTDCPMAQPRSPFPLPHHDTKSPDHRTFSKGTEALPLHGPDPLASALSM